MEQTGQSKTSRGVASYLVGALLAYGVCVVAMGKGFSSDVREAISVGLFVGVCPFVAIGPLHFFLQRGLRSLLVKHGRSEFLTRRTAVLINVPALALFLILLVPAALPPSQAARREMFERVTKMPAPDSAEIVGYKVIQGLNEGWCALAFKISEDHLDQLIKDMNLSVSATNLVEHRVNYYRERARQAGAVAFQFESPVMLYEVTITKGIDRYRKELVVGTSRCEVLLVDSYH